MEKKKRNLSPLTPRQLRIFEALSKKLKDIDDPEKEVLTDESYDFLVSNHEKYGRIVRLRFSPHDSQAKADVFREAVTVLSENQVKRRQGKTVQEARHSDAMVTEAAFLDLMHKAKKAVFLLAYVNQRFPGIIPVLQGVVKEEYSQELAFKEDKP